jgi:hypothetical protein
MRTGLRSSVCSSLRSATVSFEPVDPQLLIDQIDELVAVVNRGIALQRRADLAIRACGVTELVPEGVAVDLGVLSGEYSRLYYRVEGLKAVPELAANRRELLSLLSYHLHMLRDAGDLVFSGRRPVETERFRRELAEGLGAPAFVLAEARDRIARLAPASAGLA